MKKFDYKTLNHLKLTNSIVNKLNKIYEIRGQTVSYQAEATEVLERLTEVAKIQSTDASNRIEGIYTTDSRLKKIVESKVEPHNRSEAEISGYRDVLKLIHENYTYMPVSKNTILAMHKQLFEYTGDSWGGQFKDTNNQIITKYADGSEEIRFTPSAALITPELVEQLCTAYDQAVERSDFSPLILAGAFIFDFVSIHPFKDGNGRMSRLLMLLTLYKTGFDVGKYISLEKIIEETKPSYYETLKQSSAGWNDNQNDYEPFLDYFLGVIVKAYRLFEERLGIVGHQSLSASKLVIKILRQELRPLSMSELSEKIPQFSKITIQRTVRKLRDEQRIEMIGKGKNTKYILK